jgi:ABC-2 type transport system permease protein
VARSKAESSGYLRWRTALAFSVRRNLFSALSWAVVSFLLVVATASLYRRTYPDEFGRQRLALSLGENKALAALLGTPRRLDTVAGFVIWRSSLGIVVVVAVWALLAATKALRGDEESGRWELLVTKPLGASQLTGTSVLGIWICSLPLFLGLLLGIAAGVPRPEYRLKDAAAFAAAHTLFALVFAGVGAVCSQLFVSRRGANIAGGSALVTALLLRAISSGSARLEALSWLTPSGWLDRANPSAGIRLSPFFLLISASVLSSIAACVLSGRRDCGAAVVPRRDTGSVEGRLLGYPLVDAIRFSLPSLVGWFCATVAVCASFGAMAPGLVTAMLESEAFERFKAFIPFELVTVKGFLGLLLQFLIGVVVSLFAAAHISGVRGEEASGRLDLVLAAPVGRRTWIWSRAAIGLAEATVVALGGGLASWAGQAAFGGNVDLLPVLAASLGFVPLAIAYGGLGFFAIGIIPRRSSEMAWSVVAVTFFVYWIGSLLEAPRWILAISPFYHLSPAPLRPVNLVSSAVMAAGGAFLALVGIEAFARRDILTE